MSYYDYEFDDMGEFDDVSEFDETEEYEEFDDLAEIDDKVEFGDMHELDDMDEVDEIDESEDADEVMNDLDEWCYAEYDEFQEIPEDFREIYEKAEQEYLEFVQEHIDNPDKINEDIRYEMDDIGQKHAFGKALYIENPVRNLTAQRAAGGLDRKPWHQGSHLYSASMNGAPGEENLDAFLANLNMSPYKQLEMRDIRNLKDGAKVYLDAYTIKDDSSDVPLGVCRSTVTEWPSGGRMYECNLFENEMRTEAEIEEMWRENEGAIEEYAKNLSDQKLEEHFDDEDRWIGNW
ncbi:MAG: DNA/RNA non-specific endonuclease [Eubacteriales bacterium]|nr:DNA/RNA non-specific endonuclease [Eubacteriales bacterium]